MKLITTIVRPERLPEVKAALFRAGVTGITLSRYSGHGCEQEIFGQYRGTTVVMEFHEKVKIEMVCSEPFVEPCVKAILSAARTGEVGDGKIFVQPIERVIRIRTGELDNAALTDRKSTRLNSSHGYISYAVFCLKKKKKLSKIKLLRRITNKRNNPHRHV